MLNPAKPKKHITAAPDGGRLCLGPMYATLTWLGSYVYALTLEA